VIHLQLFFSKNWWTPPQTKYVHNVCIDRWSKRNQENRESRTIFFPSVRLSVESIHSEIQKLLFV
jgi:hypothetical protein